MSRIEKSQRLSMGECQRRALAYMAEHRPGILLRASQIGMHIWPGTNLRSQGLGGAASRVLRLLADDGMVNWRVSSDGENWGWVITSKGRSQANNGTAV